MSKSIKVSLVVKKWIEMPCSYARASEAPNDFFLYNNPSKEQVLPRNFPKLEKCFGGCVYKILSPRHSNSSLKEPP